MNKLTDTKSRLFSNGIFLQLIWLLVAAVITLLLAFFFFNYEVYNGYQTLLVHFYDTEYIINADEALVPLFLAISLLIFLVKENRKKFNRNLPNLFILAIGISLILFLTILLRRFPIYEGWTFYPPLSALGSDGKKEKEATDILTYSLTAIQILVVLALLHVTYSWGRSKNKPA